jgi:chemotaxis protein MotB
MAIKKKHEEEEKLERWLVSYADFITLLFAFFTVMYALSNSDKAKYKQAAESISASFLSGGGVFPLKGSPFTPFEKPPDKGSEVPPTNTDSGKFSKKMADGDVEKVKEQVQSLFEKSTGLSLSPGQVDVYRTEQGFKIRLAEALLYKSGSDKIKRENTAFLYEIGKRLARLDMKVQVEGHSDDREPASGENNWQLSLSRSYNLVRFLVDGAGFPRKLISVAGYGDTVPIAENKTPEGRARNRRVEISVITGNREVGDLGW